MRVAFHILGPPEGKRRPRTRVVMSQGRPMSTIYSDPADKSREAIIQALAREAMGARKPIAGPVRMFVEAVFEPAPSWSKTKRDVALNGRWHTAKPDADNIAKSVEDGCNGVVYLDDAQIAETLIRKRYGSPARTEVAVEAI